MKRIVGIIIDLILMLAVTALISASLVWTGAVVSFYGFNIELLLTIFYVVVILYGSIFEIKGGATPGKRVVKKVVVTDDGKHVGFFWIIVRNMIKVSLPSFVLFYAATSNEELVVSSATVMLALMMCLLLYMPALVNKKEKFFHDIFAGTCVVDRVEANVLDIEADEANALDIEADEANVLGIEAVEGQLKGQKWEIANGLIIGKQSNICNIVLDEFTMNIADLHCKVFERDGVIWVRDLDSSYGITLETGTRIPSNCEGTIEIGQCFTIGFGQTFKVVKE